MPYGKTFDHEVFEDKFKTWWSKYWVYMAVIGLIIIACFIGYYEFANRSQSIKDMIETSPSLPTQ